MLGGGARRIIFSDQFRLYAPQAILFEVPKHIPWLASRLRKSEIAIFNEFQLLPIIACQPEVYDCEVARATELIGRRDPLDIPLPALALARGCAVWSDDRDFEGISGVVLHKTADLLKRVVTDS
jgi:predicted nucleic acid-binding protein